MNKEIVYGLAFFSGMIYTAFTISYGVEIYKVLLLGILSIAFIVLGQAFINYKTKQKEVLKNGC